MKILVIRLGALGDICLSLGPMQAIRQHYPNAEIILMTSTAFAKFLAPCPYFDRLESVPRHSRYNPLALWRIWRWLHREQFDWVFDLQTSAVTRKYFHLMPRQYSNNQSDGKARGFGRVKANWSGHARAASHSDLVNPKRESSHTVARQAEQLRIAAIDSTPRSHFDWLADSDWQRFEVKPPFGLLVIGASARPAGKVWTVEGFAALANFYQFELGITPVLIGGKNELTAAETIINLASIESGNQAGIISLVDKTSLEDIITLARKARLMVGGDTGPAHLIAIAGTPCLMLFSRQTHPWKAAPQGSNARYLQVTEEQGSLAALPAEQVIAALQDLIKASGE